MFSTFFFLNDIIYQSCDILIASETARGSQEGHFKEKFCHLEFYSLKRVKMTRFVFEVTCITSTHNIWVSECQFWNQGNNWWTLGNFGVSIDSILNNKQKNKN